MSYIINSNDPFVSVKLTETGREKLAMGGLNFTYWAVGDSEIDYNREIIVEDNPSVIALSGASKVLRPKDVQPDIKYFVSTGTSVLNSMTNIRTVKAIINNKAEERGFFTGTTDSYFTLTTNDYIKSTGVIENTSMSGGTVIIIESGLTIGDFIMFKITNDILGNLEIDANDVAAPNLWYKIKSINNDEITVDRELPNINSGGIVDIQYYIYQCGEVKDVFGTGTTSAYWNTGTLSFVNNCTVSINDCKVWCMNSVWSENIAGITAVTSSYEDYKRFGSYQYLGEKEAYLEFGLNNTTNNQLNTVVCDGTSSLDTASKSLALIHYTNNTISNFYGEFFYINGAEGKIFEIELPTLMYHRRTATSGSGTTMGMKFIATGSTQIVGESQIQYVDLIEDPTLVNGRTPLVIGRVYPQLKIVSIHDEEIIAAMSYKSNRNWTLPSLEAKTKAPSAGLTEGILGRDETIYLTYALENNTGSGLTNSLICQKYTKVTNSTASSKDIEFILEDVDLLPYMRKIENSGYDGIGFYAYNFKLLYQIVSDVNTRPSTDAWIEVDFTSSAITTNSGETINPSLLESQTPATNGFILTNALGISNSGNIYSLNNKLNMPLNSTPEELNFGDERFFYGNIKTYIGSSIYKTIFSVNLGDNFNQTSNPTKGNSEVDLRVTEVGIYDTTQSLVAIGKLSQPIVLANGETITIEMSLDF
jgi:hypothetical protein